MTFKTHSYKYIQCALERLYLKPFEYIITAISFYTRMGHVVTILVANALKWLLLYDSHYSRVTKRLKPATNELSICKIQFQLEVFHLSTFLLVLEEPL